MLENLNKTIIHDFADSIFTGYMAKMIGVGLILSVIFLFIMAMNMYWKGAISGKSFWSFPEVSRAIVLMVCIPVTPILMQLLFAFSVAVYSSVSLNDGDKDQLKEYMLHKTDQFFKDYESKEDLKKMQNNSYNHDNVIDKNGNVLSSSTNKTDINLNGTVAKAEDPVKDESSWTDYFNFLGSPMEVFMFLIDMIVCWVFLIIRFVYTIYYIYVIKFLVLISPLVFAFSILPFSKEKISEWFGVLWNSIFVFSTFAILDALVKLNISITEEMLFSPTSGFTVDSALPRICMMLTLIILYLKVPYWTSLFAGTTGASQAFKDGLFAATQIVSTVTGTMSAASSVFSSVANKGKKNEQMRGSESSSKPESKGDTKEEEGKD